MFSQAIIEGGFFQEINEENEEDDDSSSAKEKDDDVDTDEDQDAEKKNVKFVNSADKEDIPAVSLPPAARAAKATPPVGMKKKLQISLGDDEEEDEREDLDEDDDINQRD